MWWGRREKISGEYPAGSVVKTAWVVDAGVEESEVDSFEGMKKPEGKWSSFWLFNPAGSWSL